MVNRIVFILILTGMISCKDKTTVIPESKTAKEINNEKHNPNAPGSYEVISLEPDYLVVDELDENILARLIIELVNVERKDKKLGSLQDNSILKQAAMVQNAYITSLGKLTHNGNTKDTYDLRSRVDAQGGNFSLVAENIAMKSFILNDVGGKTVIRGYSYNDVATHFFEMWKNSPGHYKNMMIEDLQHIGVSVKWKDTQRAIYATQVFGG